MIDAVPRPEVDAQTYRELEVIAMQTMMQMPHHELGHCLIIYDIQRHILRRWVNDERQARHNPNQAIADEINRSTVVRLISGEAG